MNNVEDDISSFGTQYDELRKVKSFIKNSFQEVLHDRMFESLELVDLDMNSKLKNIPSIKNYEICIGPYSGFIKFIISSQMDNEFHIIRYEIEGNQKIQIQ